MPVRIGLSSGQGRYENIRRALERLGDAVPLGTKIVIKPNFVSTTEAAAATQVEAIKAVIDALRERTGALIKIAEGAALADTFDGFRNYGYLDLKKEYSNIELVDLNRDIFETVPLQDCRGNTQTFRVAQTILRSDLRISVTPPKTHDTVGVTLSIKNMLVGSLIRSPRLSGFAFLWKPFHWFTRLLPKRLRSFFSMESLTRLLGPDLVGSDKVKLHQGYLNINLFLYQLAGLIAPHLSVIDGFEGMEGDGPVHGKTVPLDWALAGTDPLTVDRVTTRLMGFRPEDIGYLHFLSENQQSGEKEKIAFVGDSPQGIGRPFKPHRNYQRQMRWKKEMEEAGGLQEILARKNEVPHQKGGETLGEENSD